MLRERLSQGERMNRKLLALLLASLMVFGFTTPYVAAGAPSAQQTGTSTDIVQAGVGDDVASSTVSPDESGSSVAPIDPALQNADGWVDVVVRLEEAETSASMSQDAVVSTLQQQAQQTQEPVINRAHEMEGVRYVNSFWITNAVLLRVNTNEVDLDSFARMDRVTQVHANFDLTLPETERSSAAGEGASSNDYDTTYGLDQINATEVWDQYGTMGEGVSVAVLDTGVDPDHPDIQITQEHWAEFDSNGDEIPNSTIRDTDTHGTHTSGTVTGGNASGEYIGVAPEATLYHGLVIPGGGGSFAQVAGGMQWAVNESVDVISMSLGAGGYYTEMIEPSENARDAGVILVASSGNSGEGTSGSPGNVYPNIAVGASDENYDIASFSSGEEIDTSSAWGSAAPSYWPDNYTAPNVAAPGVAVKSSVPGGGYAEYDGTSMAAPHTAGAFALMLSAAGDIPRETAIDAMEENAWKPDGWSEPGDEYDTRYGLGIIDVAAATDQVALEQGINGTVTDADGNALQGITVSTDQDFSDTTDAAGAYSVLSETGTVDVTADGFGYEAATATVTVQNGTYATQNFSLTPTLDVQLVSPQPSAIEGGESLSATAQAANLESYTAELGDGYDEANATLYVNGDEVAWGEPVTFDEPTDVTATVTVETTADTSGTVSVVHTFEGLNESIEVTTGPTQVFEEFTQVGVVDDGGDYGQAVKGSLQEYLPANYQVSVMTSDEAMNEVDTYDSFVVQNIDESNGEAFASATSGVTTGVVWLDNWGSDSNGVPVRSSAIGDPANTGDAFGDGAVSYAATTDHPILEGVVAPGESVQLHTATTFNDHSWFSGSDATTLADLSTADAGVKGAGLAVDEERHAVLASTLGRETFVEDPAFTDEADQILANSVVWASDTPEPVGTVDVTETTVQPGETATVTVHSDDLENISGYQATLSFNASKLEVTGVNGIDFADPVTNIDNQNGTISMAQAGAAGVDTPEMVEIEFDVLMDDFDQSAEVSWNVGDSMVTYPNGTAPLVDWSSGMVETAACTAGDVNSDGSITVQDATLVQQYIVGQEPAGFNPSCADMNGDGQITSADVTLILEEIVGSSVSAPQPVTTADLVGAQLQADA